MRKILVGAVTLVSLMMPLQAFAEEPIASAEALLHQMDEASRELSYELSYILIKKNSIEPLRYRHALEDGQTYAHLIYLSGPPREVIQRGNEISYFEPGLDPFTIDSNKMVAPLPPIMQSDINELSANYDFISMGRAREAGVACDVVRIAPKDGARYSYLLWIDNRNRLVMRADLLDRDGEPLEQYRAVSYVVNPKVGDVYVSGEQRFDDKGRLLKEIEYLQFAKKIIKEQGWIEKEISEPIGIKMLIEMKHKDRKRLEVEKIFFGGRRDCL